jgi:hypothetical protein
MTVVLAFGVGVAMVVLNGGADQSPPPVPNGYERFLEAGNALVGQLPDEMKGSGAETREFVRSNQEAFRLIREGLMLESMVVFPTGVDATTHATQHLAEVKAFKMLGRGLVAEGLIAASEGRPADAVRHHLECVRFGQACSRGGSMMDRLVGFALERIGLNHLDAMQPELDASQTRSLVRALEEVEADAESAEDTLGNERRYVRRLFPWWQRLVAKLMPQAIKPVLDNFRSKQRVHTQVFRSVILKLAVHAHTLETGAPPRTLLDLVPGYLAGVPLDPVSGKSFPYDPATGVVTVPEGESGRSDPGKRSE